MSGLKTPENRTETSIDQFFNLKPGEDIQIDSAIRPISQEGTTFFRIRKIEIDSSGKITTETPKIINDVDLKSTYERVLDELNLTENNSERFIELFGIAAQLYRIQAYPLGN